MNKQQWQSRIEELRKELADLEANPPKRELGERWKPNEGEKFWLVGVGGDLLNRTWDGDGYDLTIYDNFSLFETEEEAEFARERTKVMRELDLWAADELLPPNEIYGIFCDSSGELGVFVWPYKYSPYVFGSRKVAEQAIEAIGEDRLKKYYFKVVD
ncbi:TPA: hypothetical protein ACGO1T_000877 [Streptococcus suis]